MATPGQGRIERRLAAILAAGARYHVPAAKMLGLTIPLPLLGRADEVIE